MRILWIIFLADELVGSAQYVATPVPANPTIYTATMNYPQNGTESYNITAVWVELTHNHGARNVFSIPSGGVGQSNAVFRIQSENTTNFAYLARIYGQPLWFKVINFHWYHFKTLIKK